MPNAPLYMPMTSTSRSTAANVDFRLACGPSWLFPFEHQDVRRALIRGVHRLRQSLEIGRKLDLLSVRDLALDLVGDFQSALVQPACRVCRAAGTSGSRWRSSYTPGPIRSSGQPEKHRSTF